MRISGCAVANDLFFRRAAVFVVPSLSMSAIPMNPLIEVLTSGPAYLAKMGIDESRLNMEHLLADLQRMMSAGNQRFCFSTSRAPL